MITFNSSVNFKVTLLVLHAVYLMSYGCCCYSISFQKFEKAELLKAETATGVCSFFIRKGMENAILYVDFLYIAYVGVLRLQNVTFGVHVTSIWRA